MMRKTWGEVVVGDCFIDGSTVVEVASAHGAVSAQLRRSDGTVVNVLCGSYALTPAMAGSATHPDFGTINEISIGTDENGRFLDLHNGEDTLSGFEASTALTWLAIWFTDEHDDMQSQLLFEEHIRKENDMLAQLAIAWALTSDKRAISAALVQKANDVLAARVERAKRAMTAIDGIPR